MKWVLLCLGGGLSLFDFFRVCTAQSSSSIQNIPSFPAIYNTETWVPIRGEVSPNDAAPPKSQPAVPYESNPNTVIFIGLVEYRDARCSRTIDNLLSKAKYPDRLRIGKRALIIYQESCIHLFLNVLGVVQQRHTEEDHYHCIKDYCAGHNPCPHQEHISMIGRYSVLHHSSLFIT